MQQEEGFSLESQPLALEAAVRDGEEWTRAWLDVESGRGAKREKREQLAAMLAAAEAGEFDVLIFRDLTRLARSQRDAFDIIERLTDLGIAVRAKSGMEFDPRSAVGKFQLQMLGAAAEFESDLIAERTAEGKATAARHGRPNGGPRRYGFEKGAGKTGMMVPIPAEVAVARWMMERFVGGWTQKRIAAEANALGYRTARGRLWAQTQVSQLFDDPIWVGIMKNAEGEFPATFPDGKGTLLVPRALWDAVQATRAPKTGKRTNGRRSARFLLANGMLKCTCGSSMRGKRNKKDYGYWEGYVCAGRYDGSSPDCRQPAIRRERIDSAVLDYFAEVGLDIAAMIEERQRSRDQRLARLGERIKNAERTAEAAERKIETLDAALADGLTPERYARAVQAPEAELAAAQGALEDLRAERTAAEAEPDLGDAEQEVLEHLAELRAAVAGEVTENAGDLGAAQAALRRTFSGFVLTEAGEEHWGEDLLETGTGYLLEPVVRPEMMALGLPPLVPWFDVKRTTPDLSSAKTPANDRGGSNASKP